VNAVEQAAADAIKQFFGTRRLATLADSEAFLSVSHSKMKNLIRSGQVQSAKIGGSRRIVVESLRNVAANGTDGTK
jgi:hypothetical protein